MAGFKLSQLVIVCEHTPFPGIITRLDRPLEREAFDPFPIFGDVEKFRDRDRCYTKASVALIGNEAVSRETCQGFT